MSDAPRTEIEPTPTADDLWAAFFAGNDNLINPYHARPVELLSSLRAVWLAGWLAGKKSHDKDTLSPATWPFVPADFPLYK